MLVKRPGLIASLIGGAVVAFGAIPASAATLSGAIAAAPDDSSYVEQVQPRRSERYDERHGPSVGFSVTVPGLSFGLGTPRAPRTTLPEAHVRWCLNHYRTYDPATDTYVPRAGTRARCHSPYWP